MTKVTPWDEARREAIDTTHDDHKLSVAIAIDRLRITLSRLGYRLVPAEATEEMRTAFRKERVLSPLNAATEAGDVLRVKP